MRQAAHTAYPGHPGAFWPGSAAGSGEQHTAWAKLWQPGRPLRPLQPVRYGTTPCTGGAPVRARWRVGEGTDWFTGDWAARTRPMRAAHLSTYISSPGLPRSQLPGPLIYACAYDMKEERGRMHLIAKRASESVISWKKCPGRTGMFFHSVFCLIPQLLKLA